MVHFKEKHTVLYNDVVISFQNFIYSRSCTKRKFPMRDVTQTLHQGQDKDLPKIANPVPFFIA